MKLDRGLIKQQAKQLIQNNVLKLFAVSIIVSLCMSAISGGISIVVNAYNIANGNSIFSIFREDFDDYLDDYLDDYYDENADNYFNNFGNDTNEFGEDFNNFGNEYNFNEFGNENDFYNFGQDDGLPPHGFGSMNPYDNSSYGLGNVLIASGIMSVLSFIASVCQLLLAPLAISLTGYYVSFIRGRKADISDGINTVFRETFKNNYGKKIALTFLRGLFTVLLGFLFIIPGIIYFYSTYFAFQIMADNPEISPMQALKLSRKMVRGNRTELFVLDLSFIPWSLLCIFVFPLIYVMPYISTTQALFYENFRIRALQQGRVTEDDFLSDQQRYNKYANIYANPNSAAPNNENYQQSGYQPYNQPHYNQQNANPYYTAQPNTYQQGNPQYYAPNQNAYNAPPQQAANTNAPKAEEPINQAAPEQENTDTSEQSKTFETRDPWEINHED